MLIRYTRSKLQSHTLVHRNEVTAANFGWGAELGRCQMMSACSLVSTNHSSVSMRPTFRLPQHMVQLAAMIKT